jgi:hypothetical protein
MAIACQYAKNYFSKFLVFATGPCFRTFFAGNPIVYIPEGPEAHDAKRAVDEFVRFFPGFDFPGNECILKIIEISDGGRDEKRRENQGAAAC